MHDDLETILSYLSFTEKQVEHITKTANSTLKEAVQIKLKQAEVKKEQLKSVLLKIERLEERLVNDEIETETYRKYYRKFQSEKSLLNEEISYLNNLQEDILSEQLALLTQMTALTAIYKRSNLNQKHALLNGVFKHGLSYSEGAFRTPYINPVLTHNLLIMNEKGLLFLEQPDQDFDTIPCGAEEGTRTPTP